MGKRERLTRKGKREENVFSDFREESGAVSDTFSLPTSQGYHSGAGPKYFGAVIS